jgi:hypothetical protein
LHSNCKSYVVIIILLVCMFDFMMVDFRLFKHWTEGWTIWNSTFSRFPLSFFCLQFEYSMGYSFVVSNSAAAQYFYWNATRLQLIRSTNSQDKESENMNINRKSWDLLIRLCSEYFSLLYIYFHAWCGNKLGLFIVAMLHYGLNFSTHCEYVEIYET